MIQLLKEENFKQLFNLLDVLYKVSKLDDYQVLWLAVVETKLEDSTLNETLEGSFDDPHELVKPLSADHLLHDAWELILMLPTNLIIKNKFTQLDFCENVQWSQYLNLEQKFRLLYILQILDGLSLPLMKTFTSGIGADSSGDSDSSLSDVDVDRKDNFSLVWINKLFENGFVKHLLGLLLSDELQPENGQDEWTLNCLAYIMKILTRIGLVNITPDEKPAATSGTASDASEKTPVPQKRYIFRARYRSTEAENIVVIQCFNKVCNTKVVMQIQTRQFLWFYFYRS